MDGDKFQTQPGAVLPTNKTVYLKSSLPETRCILSLCLVVLSEGKAAAVS